MSTVTVSSPWHAGELAIQARAGVIERMADVGRRNVRDAMPEQHREFFAQLPFVALGTVDEHGDAWATMRAGRPGFIHSPDRRALQIDMTPDLADPAANGLRAGEAMALLGIELHTRRRNRMNGSITAATPNRIDIAVAQSFGNCPQYIQLRAVEFTRDPADMGHIAPVESASLDARTRDLIAHAATFFVATYADLDTGRQVDVSHRGGKPGFVRIDENGRLTIPDFAGNLFFNTLGNMLANGRAGLVFVDFATGALLQLTGQADVVLDSPEIGAFQGAERLWHFTPERVVYREDALPIRWTDAPNGASPNALMTGDWDDAARRMKAAEVSKSWRKLRVTKIVDESTTIRSFHFEPLANDEAGLIAHRAGQHLPLRVTLSGGAAPVIRSYTLSVAPSDNTYRISVKRDGAVSAYLHDTLKVGDLIDTRAPAGEFTIDALERRPAVMLAAGIGITPMLAMLRHVVYEGVRKRRVRPTWVFYSERTAAGRAFMGELNQLVADAQGEVRLIRALSDTASAQKGVDYDVSGRIDMDVLHAKLPFDDYDFYLCGPAAFMQSMYDGLRALNIDDARIHAEAFGPSGLIRAGRTQDDGPRGEPAVESVPVTFVSSGKEARWTPGEGTLLELAEARGLSPAFGCRSGSCSTCRAKIVQGAVAYPRAPSYEIGNDEALVCCSVPAKGSAPLQLDL